MWITVIWRDRKGHQHICHIQDFTNEHVGLFYEVSIPNDFPYLLGCEIVDQYYLTGCICDLRWWVQREG